MWGPLYALFRTQERRALQYGEIDGGGVRLLLTQSVMDAGKMLRLGQT
jgi:hypothetical protein